MAIKTGTDGDDTLYGSAYGDQLYGGDGDDVLKGFGGADRLYGGNGIDTAFYADSTVGVSVNLSGPHARGYGGSAEGDRLYSIENVFGSNHNDSLTGDDGANTLTGAGGNDILKGGGGTDTLDGGSNDDTLKGGGGADDLVGGPGSDTADYSASPSTGSGSLLYGVFVYLDANIAGYGDAQFDTFSGIENLTGSAYLDHLRGDNGANVLRGLDGNDSLEGEGGDDILNGGAGGDALYGGSGADIMIGGTGDDFYSIEDATDTVIEYAGQGIDMVSTRVSWTLTAGADVEYLEAQDPNDFDNTAAIDVTGNSSGNVVIGNDGNNVINGGDGDDELTGRDGQDSFLFNTALNAATNLDEITDFNVADDTIRLDDAIFASSLGLGSVAGSQFVIGAAATDANHRIIYNDATGAVLYDSDGTGATAAIQFAQVSAGLALTNFDFFVV